jgi:hypothetical protein
MGTVFPELGDQLRGWIADQPMFFVATAPSGDDGHLNLSPKGGRGTLTVLGPHELAYVDLFGSGIETVAHVKQNGRIVLMWCAFNGPPMIIRVHGRAEVVEMTDARFPELLARFDLPTEARGSVRGMIRVDITRVADSCGFVVPRMDYRDERHSLYKTADAWLRQDGPEAIQAYCDVNNLKSIDDLTGLSPFGVEVTEEQRARFTHDGHKL